MTLPPTRRTPWLVPPRLRTTAEDPSERRASWLELFFDLVFVVAITELAHQVVDDHSVAGFARFAGLFVPVYVAWQGFMAYADRFDTDDVAFRATYFAAMLAISAMAVLIGVVANGERSAAFAISYVVLRCLMLGLDGDCGTDPDPTVGAVLGAGRRSDAEPLGKQPEVVLVAL